MLYISGDCKNSMSYSFFNDSDTSLEKFAAKYNVEFEAYCIDQGEPTWFEHCHYKGSECLENLYLQQVWQIDPDELDADAELPSPETLEKYYENPEPGLYILKDEFLACSYDYETGELDCDFTMSFDDLKGKSK